MSHVPTPVIEVATMIDAPLDDENQHKQLLPHRKENQ